MDNRIVFYMYINVNKQSVKNALLALITPYTGLILHHFLEHIRYNVDFIKYLK